MTAAEPDAGTAVTSPSTATAPCGAVACDECQKILLTKRLEAEEAERVRRHDLAKQHDAAAAALRAKAEEARLTGEWQLVNAYHQTLAEVSKGSIDRARDGAKYVQTAATAIAALYTGALGLVFSVTDNPLPLRGVLAPVFLGLSIALATAYLAFITRPPAVPLELDGRSPVQYQYARTAHLTRWIAATVRNRRWAIRASVVSLAFGVAFMAAPFVASGGASAVPDAPTAPPVPAAVAPIIEDDAAELFRVQAASYEAAQDARNQAIERAAQASAAHAASENDLDVASLVVAGVALALVILLPFCFDDADDRAARRGEPEPAHVR